ncbi:hypothetical protein GCM10010435_95400 [Winogradskya consettensis]|uniref:Uncharacterized protein n=1 Tax=Winogradskya consettensis TaxID=113560 RepID=A0A919W1K9_9ACTN|nr:hypothetical protein [Actinoplanes consettensis]GIM83722.1 hypothetical protein Aco04nite_87960 [Actinoplanes consettensis]
MDRTGAGFVLERMAAWDQGDVRVVDEVMGAGFTRTREVSRSDHHLDVG